MKHLLHIKLFLGLLSLHLFAAGQVVTSDPVFPSADRPVTITFDATKGTGGLKGYSGDVYAHTGVITEKSTSGSDWKYVKTNWGENTPATLLSRISTDLYSLEIAPNIREYFGVPVSEKITDLAFVFRSSDSNLEGKDDGGSDIFLELYEEGFNITIVKPAKNVVVQPGTAIEFEAASSEDADLSLFLNNVPLKSSYGLVISDSIQINDQGDYWIRVEAYIESETVGDSVFVHAMGVEEILTLPEGLSDGINYEDEQTAHLVLYAPGKEHAFLIGEFNQWTPQTDSRMFRDGDRFWITLSGLEPGKEYVYQYLVDGTIAIADPYTEKILDPSNDKGIGEDTYPGLKPYPAGLANGIAGILQTGQTPYEWKHDSYSPPSSEKLVIYELLVRDFIEAHNWLTLTDTLAYLTSLGINAIELMPVNEFEGNESWGYNPSFYFAPDKYYGPAQNFKAFIDSCHAQGIAVIIDMVFNHSYGQSPLVQLYFDGTAGKVSADNPWYNVNSPNPVFSWGYDFNHESQATKNFIDRVNRYWIEKFHVDGFRYDFTKGFTNTPGDGSGYDAPRIANLKRMADSVWAVDERSILILEHFATNQEEKVLADYGFLLWGNSNYNYNEATMGYHENGKSDFSWISYKNRGWSTPALVGYMESHDEERLMFKNMDHGNSGGIYDVQDLSTSLSRMELAGAFFFTVPGPKMIWQFGELGYDYSIDEDCRVCNKPIRWDYYDEDLRKRIYQVWSALIRLKISEPAFSTQNFSVSLSEAAKRIELNHPDMDVRILGNFDVAFSPLDPSFSMSGWWYDYFSGDSLWVEDTHNQIGLQAGEYKIYTSKKLARPNITAWVSESKPERVEFKPFPNPVGQVLYMNPLATESSLTFSDLAGNVVLVLDLPSNTMQVDVSGLPEGLYLIKRLTGNSDPEFAKVLKLSR